MSKTTRYLRVKRTIPTEKVREMNLAEIENLKAKIFDLQKRHDEFVEEFTSFGANEAVDIVVQEPVEPGDPMYELAETSIDPTLYRGAYKWINIE